VKHEEKSSTYQKMIVVTGLKITHIFTTMKRL